MARSSRRRSSRRQWLILAVGGALVLLIALLGGYLALRSGEPAPSRAQQTQDSTASAEPAPSATAIPTLSAPATQDPSPSASASPSATASASPSASPSESASPSADVVAPKGVPADQPYLAFGDTSDTARPIDVYLDALCPYCKMFSDDNGDAVRQLAQEPGIQVRVHLRPMLNRATNPPGYSGRAANAALCVYDEKPDAYWAMEKSLFAQQPQEGSAGLSDEQLIELAHGAGASGAVDQCITSGRFIPYLEKVVEPEAKGQQIGTPSIFIDGEQWDGDWQKPGELKKAVTARQ